MEQDFCIASSIVDDFHGSLFEYVFKLAPIFNFHSLNKSIVQTFYNYFIANDNREIECINKELGESTVRKKNA